MYSGYIYKDIFTSSEEDFQSWNRSRWTIKFDKRDNDKANIAWLFYSEFIKIKMDLKNSLWNQCDVSILLRQFKNSYLEILLLLVAKWLIKECMLNGHTLAICHQVCKSCTMDF